MQLRQVASLEGCQCCLPLPSTPFPGCHHLQSMAWAFLPCHSFILLHPPPPSQAALFPSSFLPTPSRICFSWLLPLLERWWRWLPHTTCWGQAGRLVYRAAAATRALPPASDHHWSNLDKAPTPHRARCPSSGERYGRQWQQCAGRNISQEKKRGLGGGQKAQCGRPGGGKKSTTWEEWVGRWGLGGRVKWGSCSNGHMCCVHRAPPTLRAWPDPAYLIYMLPLWT